MTGIEYRLFKNSKSQSFRGSEKLMSTRIKSQALMKQI